MNSTVIFLVDDDDNSSEAQKIKDESNELSHYSVTQTSSTAGVVNSIRQQEEGGVKNESDCQTQTSLSEKSREMWR